MENTDSIDDIITRLGLAVVAQAEGPDGGEACGGIGRTRTVSQRHFDGVSFAISRAFIFWAYAGTRDPHDTRSL